MQIRLPPFPRAAVLSVLLVAAACAEHSPTAAVPPDVDRWRPIVIVPTDPTCVWSAAYWKNNLSSWDDSGDAKLFTTSDLFYSSGKSYLTILTMQPKGGGNDYLKLAQQFIVASLNLNGAMSGVPEVDDAMSAAIGFFSTAGPGSAEPMRAQLRAWEKTLSEFNKGKLGLPRCE
jgi:hypothetical protein